MKALDVIDLGRMRYAAAFKVQRRLLLACAILFATVPPHMSGQPEKVLRPRKLIPIADIAKLDWAAGLRPATVLAMQDRLYVLLLPSSLETQYSSLLVLAQDGSTINDVRMSPKVTSTVGVDEAGNLKTFRRDSKTRDTIETRSNDGALLNEYTVGGSVLAVQSAEQNLNVSLGPYKAPSMASNAEAPGEIRAISAVRTRNHQQWVEAFLEDGRTIRLNLTRPEVFLLGRDDSVLSDRALGRALLDRYSTVMQSSDPHVTYPELYSPAISPNGKLYALVGNAVLADGAIVVEVGTDPPDFRAVFRLILPVVPGLQNADNPGSYLMPSAIAFTKHYALIVDRGSGILVEYNNDF